MQPRLIPSPTNFIARIPEGARAETVFADLISSAEYEPIPGHPELWLIRLKKTAADSRTAWRKLRAALGPRIDLAPAFIDEDQRFRFPTGVLTARFPSEPTDTELAAFGTALGLGAPKRNKFVPRQVSFRPAGEHTFLPDLLAQIRDARPDLVNVWPETLSEYRRT